VADVLQIAISSAAALNRRQGRHLHTDIKPANLMIARKLRVKLDFRRLLRKSSRSDRHVFALLHVPDNRGKELNIPHDMYSLGGRSMIAHRQELSRGNHEMLVQNPEPGSSAEQRRPVANPWTPSSCAAQRNPSSHPRWPRPAALSNRPADSSAASFPTARSTSL